MRSRLRRRQPRKRKEKVHLEVLRTLEQRPTRGAWYEKTSAWVESQEKETTRNNASVALRRLDAFLLSKEVDLAADNVLVDRDHVKAYYAYLEETYPESTARQYIRRLKGLFVFLHQQENGLPLLHSAPPERMRVEKSRKVTDEEMDKIWETANKDERVVISLLRYFRLDVQAILQLKADDVRLDGETIVVKQKRKPVYTNAGAACRYAKSVYKQKDAIGPDELLVGNISQRTLYRRVTRAATKANLGRKIMPCDF